MKKILPALILLAAFTAALPAQEESLEKAETPQTAQVSAKKTKVKLTKEEKKALKEQKKLQRITKKAEKEIAKEKKWQEKQDEKTNRKEEIKEEKEKKETEENTPKEGAMIIDGFEINPKTGFPKIIHRPFVIWDEGASFAMPTRLQKEDNRSNFVWQDYMIGAYCAMRTENMKPVNSMIRIQAFYPFYHTFNGMRQYPKQTILYAFDLFAGPMLQTDMWKYVRLNFAGGLHYMYQLSDEYHLNYLGAGLLAGIELPVHANWTILMDGTFTLDYANLGTNRLVQPFDYEWQYQLSLGVRYSRKKTNKYAYIHKRAPKAKKNINR